MTAQPAGPSVTVTSFMTDSDFNEITGADAVFTSSKTTTPLTATNLGTYYLNTIFQNSGSSAATVQAVISIPPHTSPRWHRRSA